MFSKHGKSHCTEHLNKDVDAFFNAHKGKFSGKN